MRLVWSRKGEKPRIIWGVSRAHLNQRAHARASRSVTGGLAGCMRVHATGFLYLRMRMESTRAVDQSR